MIRADHLVVSRPMYAFNPASWRKTAYGSIVDAIWFKRKSGILTATMGSYRLANRTEYSIAVEFHEDNRYGGGWDAMWDGSYLTTADRRTEFERAEILTILGRALDRHPEVPEGYDGWWSFDRR